MKSDDQSLVSLWNISLGTDVQGSMSMASRRRQDNMDLGRLLNKYKPKPGYRTLVKGPAEMTAEIQGKS